MLTTVEKNHFGPYILAIWYGRGIPNDVNIFLQDFIDEMTILIADGHINIDVKVTAFICDAPARSV